MTDQLILDRTNDTLTDLFAEFLSDGPTGADEGAYDLIDDATHAVAAYIEAAMRSRNLAQMEAELDAAGGRGVALADEIDSLRHHRTLVLRIPMILAEPNEEPSGAEVATALLDNLGDDWWTCTSGDDRFALSDGDAQLDDDPDNAASLYPSYRRPTAEIL